MGHGNRTEQRSEFTQPASQNDSSADPAKTLIKNLPVSETFGFLIYIFFNFLSSYNVNLSTA